MFGKVLQEILRKLIYDNVPLNETQGFIRWDILSQAVNHLHLRTTAEKICSSEIFENFFKGCKAVVFLSPAVTI